MAALVSLVSPNSIDLTFLRLLLLFLFGFSFRFLFFSLEFPTFIYSGLCVPSHSGNRIDVRTTYKDRKLVPCIPLIRFNIAQDFRLADG